MKIEEIWEQLDLLFQKNELEQVEPFLSGTLKQAAKEEEYGIYISVANEMIGFYRSTSQHEKAFNSAEDVLLLMEELQMDGTEHFATTLLNTATAYRAAGKQKEAFDFYRRALQIYEQVLAPEDYRFAGLYNNMSILLEQNGEDEQAAMLLKRALEIVDKIQGAEMECAATMTNLALVDFKLKQYDDAEKLLKDAITIFESAEQGSDAHYSAALAGMGEAYYHLGKYTESLSYYEKALEEVRKHFGENDSYRLLCENCASVCEAMQDIDKTSSYRQKASGEITNPQSGNGTEKT